MNLDQLTSELQRLAAFEAVRNRLLGDPGHPATVSVADAAKPYVLAALHAALDRPLLLITARPSQARSLREEIACWHPRPSSVLLFPEQDILPFEPLPADQQTTAERLSVLTRLVQAPPVVLHTARDVLDTLKESRKCLEFGRMAHSLERIDSCGNRVVQSPFV